MLSNYEIEARGVKEGINPMFGEWYHKFEFEPVPYSTKNNGLKEEFKRKFREQLKNKYLFSGEISVTIILYLNEQKKLERLKYADLDNYAKQLLDCMKGCKGLFIDDCQVQHLDISWIDIPDNSYFEITIKSHPDFFLLKPIKLYEMPDKLYYPVSLYRWTKEGIVKRQESEIIDILKLLHYMIDNKIKIRHQLRREKKSELEAYHLSQMIAPILMGFHKSYVENSDCELIDFKSWENLLI